MTTAGTTHLVYGETYGGTAPENYERYFVPAIGGPLAADLVDSAGLRPGDRVLDVGCGTGVVARLAAERVGPNGVIGGVDINAAMLAVARAHAGTHGARIRWYETAAESMPLPDDSFDVVFCQLALQFIGDKAAALREIRRVLTAGGRAFVSTPCPNPFFEVLDRAMGRHVGEVAADFVRTVFSVNDARTVEVIFRNAGWHQIAVRTEIKTLRLPPAKEFLWQYVHCTPMTGLLAELNAERIAAIEQEVVREWQPWSRAGGMSYEQPILVATART